MERLAFRDHPRLSKALIQSVEPHTDAIAKRLLLLPRALGLVVLLSILQWLRVFLDRNYSDTARQLLVDLRGPDWIHPVNRRCAQLVQQLLRQSKSGTSQAMGCLEGSLASDAAFPSSPTPAQ